MHCKNCGRVISNLIDKVDGDFLADADCEEHLVPKGKFWLAEDFGREIIRDGTVVINIRDVIGLRKHPDTRRHNGCCGEDGCDGPNLVCECGDEVATEVSDCWTPHYAHFNSDTTELRTPNAHNKAS